MRLPNLRYTEPFEIPLGVHNICTGLADMTQDRRELFSRSSSRLSGIRYGILWTSQFRSLGNLCLSNEGVLPKCRYHFQYHRASQLTSSCPSKGHSSPTSLGLRAPCIMCSKFTAWGSKSVWLANTGVLWPYITLWVPRDSLELAFPKH